MPTLARGWAPLRGVLVGREKFIDLPIQELYDLRADARRERRTSRRFEAIAWTLLQNVLREFDVAPPGRPAEETAGGARAAARAWLHEPAVRCRFATVSPRPTIPSG